MHCGKLEEYPYPDKRKAPRTSTFNQERRMKTKAIQLDNFVLKKIQLVNTMKIQNYIKSLTSFHNRHTKTANKEPAYIHEAARSIKDQLINFGYSEEFVFYHEYTERGYELKNVVCIKKGESNKTIILCAHYDTILNSNWEDITSRASRSR